MLQPMLFELNLCLYNWILSYLTFIILPYVIYVYVLCSLCVYLMLYNMSVVVIFWLFF